MFKRNTERIQLRLWDFLYRIKIYDRKKARKEPDFTPLKNTSILTYISQGRRLYDVYSLFTIITLYRLPIAYQNSWFWFNPVLALRLQFDEILKDVEMFLKCLLLIATVKYAPYMIIDCYRTIRETRSATACRVVMNRFVSFLAADLSNVSIGAHIQGSIIMFCTPLAIWLASYGRYQQSDGTRKSFFIRCVVILTTTIAFTSFMFMRMNDEFNFLLVMVSFFIINIATMYGVWCPGYTRSFVTWNLVRPTWVNAIQFISAIFQAVQLVAIYVAVHSENHINWKGSQCESIANGLLLKSIPTVTLVLTILYLSVVSLTVTLRTRHGYLYVYSNLIGDGLVFGIIRGHQQVSKDGRENGDIGNLLIWSLCFISFLGCCSNHYHVVPEFEYRWIQDVSPTSIYGTVLTMSNFITALIFAIDSPVVVHTAIFINCSVVMLASLIINKEPPCTSFVFFVFKIFLSCVVVSITTMIRYGVVTGLLIGASITLLGIYVAWNANYRSIPVDEGEFIYPSQIRLELICMKEKLEAGGYLWPSFYKTTWVSDVLRAERTSELAYCLLMLEYDTKYEALETPFISIRNSWISGLSVWVERCDFVRYHSQDFRDSGIPYDTISPVHQLLKSRYMHCGRSHSVQDQSCGFNEQSDYYSLLLQTYLFKNSISDPCENFIQHDEPPLPLPNIALFTTRDDDDSVFSEVEMMPSFFYPPNYDMSEVTVDYIRLVDDPTVPEEITKIKRSSNNNSEPDLLLV